MVTCINKRHSSYRGRAKKFTKRIPKMSELTYYSRLKVLSFREFRAKADTC